MDFEIISLIWALVHLVGIVAAADAVYWSKTPQGAVGWGISLLSMPLVAGPLYLFLGRNKFRGHRRSVQRRIDLHRRKIQEGQAHSQGSLSSKDRERGDFEKVTGVKFIPGNDTKLILKGRESFDLLFDAIRRAEKYILLQYYIVQDDTVGSELKRVLIERAAVGVKIYFMYDAWGSSGLSSEYISELRAAGCQIRPFETRHKIRDFFQLNFRNHRKMTIVDGRIAFIGGINIGDEYRSDKVGTPWIDAQLQVQGPAILSLQAAFVADWHWASGVDPEVLWTEALDCGEQSILPALTGPADLRESCSFLFLEAILSAKKRIWIATPYFVPDEAILKALQLAALRGVEVLILLPEQGDNLLVRLASYAYMPEVISHGVKVFFYQQGFLHKKTFLVDDDLGAVGSANWDYRSLRLNFEVTLLVNSKELNRELSIMFEDDLKHSIRCNISSYYDLSLSKRYASKFARLFAPIL